MKSRDFLGCGIKFPLQIDPKTGKIATSSHEQNIAESIDIIITTQKGERVMRPDFGSSVADYLFSSNDYSVKDALAYDIKKQLTLQEPRIKEIEVTCSEHSSATGELIMDVAYVVRSTNNRYNRVYPFFTGESV
ncbi:baseplate protein [Clostridia bacterium]|nr:baseplate protein [Clostridia bacterium]